MIDTIWTVLLGSLFLTLPYAWEVPNDRKGDKDKRLDVYKRGALMVFVAALNAALNGRNLRDGFLILVTSFNESLAWFFMFFDYTIAWVLLQRHIVELKNVTWFDYLGKVGDVDNWAPWRGLTAKRRLWIRIAYFVVSTAVYVLYLIFRK